MGSIRRIGIFIGRKGAIWLAVMILGSFLLVLAEFGVAAFIQVFLASSGLMEKDLISPRLAPLVGYGTTTIVALLLILGVFRGLATLMAQSGSFLFGELVSLRLKVTTVYELLLSPESGKLSGSQVNTRLGEVFPKAINFIAGVSSSLILAIQVLTLLGVLFLIAWKEALIGSAGITLIGLGIRRLNQSVARHTRILPATHASTIETIERVTRNFLFVTISGTKEKEYQDSLKLLVRYFKTHSQAKLLGILAASLPPAAGVFLLAGIIYLSLSVFQTKAITLMAFLYIFMRAIQLLAALTHQLSHSATLTEHFCQACTAFFGLDTNSRNAALSGIASIKIFKPNRSGDLAGSHKIGHSIPFAKAPSLVFDQVNFAWKPNTHNIIRAMNFHINAGSGLGIIGESGVGKSTLLYLISGMVSPAQGRVSVGGMPASDFLSQHSQSIGYVGADPYLFDGTVKENLLYGLTRKEGCNEDIWECLEQAQIAAAIRALPDQLETRIDASGSPFSTGQKQRLAIARALIRRPKLLILDEASANLDVKTESMVVQSLRSFLPDCTMVIVTHREGMLRAADRTLKMLPECKYLLGTTGSFIQTRA